MQASTLRGVTNCKFAPDRIQKSIAGKDFALVPGHVVEQPEFQSSRGDLLSVYKNLHGGRVDKHVHVSGRRRPAFAGAKQGRLNGADEFSGSQRKTQAVVGVGLEHDAILVSSCCPPPKLRRCWKERGIAES